MAKARLSSKGRITIPKFILTAHKWESGTEFAIFDTDQGVLFAPIKPFKPIAAKQVMGCANYKGPRKSLRDMERGIIEMAKKSHTKL